MKGVLSRYHAEIARVHAAIHVVAVTCSSQWSRSTENLKTRTWQASLRHIIFPLNLTIFSPE